MASIIFLLKALITKMTLKNLRISKPNTAFTLNYILIVYILLVHKEIDKWPYLYIKT